MSGHRNADALGSMRLTGSRPHTPRYTLLALREAPLVLTEKPQRLQTLMKQQRPALEQEK